MEPVWQMTDFTLSVELEKEIRDYYSADLTAQPSGAPDLDTGIAFSAAVALYRFAQAWLIRSIPKTWIQEIRDWMPGALENRSTQYSADLFLRYLPSVYRPAKRLNASDPLVTEIEYWFCQFPLSSIGSGYTVPEIQTYLSQDRFLQILFLDRVSAWKDAQYLEQDWIQHRFIQNS